eukprot:251458_1
MYFIPMALMVVHALGMGNNVTLLIRGSDMNATGLLQDDYIVAAHLGELSDLYSEQLELLAEIPKAGFPIPIDQFPFSKDRIVQIFQHLFPAKLTPGDMHMIQLSENQKMERASRHESGGISFKSLSSGHYLSADTRNPSTQLTNDAKWIITNLSHSGPDQNGTIFGLRNFETKRWLRFFEDGTTLDCGQNIYVRWTSLKLHRDQSNRFIMIQSNYFPLGQFVGIQSGTWLDTARSSARQTFRGPPPKRQCALVPIYHFLQNVYDLFLDGNDGTPFTNNLELTCQIFTMSHFLGHAIGLSLSRERILLELNSGGSNSFNYSWLDFGYPVWAEHFLPLMILEAKIDALPHLVEVSDDGKVRRFDIDEEAFQKLDNPRFQICLSYIGSGAFANYDIFKFRPDLMSYIMSSAFMQNLLSENMGSAFMRNIVSTENVTHRAINVTYRALI